MSSARASQSPNAAVRSKAKPSPDPLLPTPTKKFRSAGQPAGKASTSQQAKMLGENRYNPNPAQTTTDPFTLPPFPEKQKMDGDDRSSISDSDETVANSVDGKPAPGKKTRGRVRIQMEYIQNKLRRYTTFSKRKSGIMKKAYELSTLTGTQVMLLVASETGHVYTFATPKLQPMITSETGKALIQTCLHQPDPPMPHVVAANDYDVRMSASGYEETELNYGGLPESEESYKGLEPHAHAIPSCAAPMHAIVNPGSIVSMPHGIVPVPTFSDGNPIMAAPIHQLHHVQQPSPPSSLSPPHHSPPPSYSPPQPTSPPRSYNPSYPASPPSVTSYSQASHVHQGGMMEELHSPGHLGIESYERSPSRSPIRYSSPHNATHSPQVLYATSSGSPPMVGHCHSPAMRI